MAAYTFTTNKGHRNVLAKASAEAKMVVGITRAFVNTYAEYQSQYAKGLLPVPASFRFDALNRADDDIITLGEATSVVGFPGKEIRIKPTDENMKNLMLQIQQTKTADSLERQIIKDGKRTHRILFPFYASVPSCASCHNELQNLTEADKWQVGDLMGAQFVDQNIDKQLQDMTRTALLISILFFLTSFALSYCGFFLYKQFLLGRKLKVLATTDSMTGCINRREMYSRISQITGRANGALLMLDLDHFKKINDAYGHAAGDAVIQTFTARIKRALRSSDWVARIGGEEFIVWLPDIKPHDALVVSERLRKESECTPLQRQHETISYTVSIGLHIVNNAPPSRLDSWIQAADALLYKAKEQGRNRIVFQRELFV